MLKKIIVLGKVSAYTLGRLRSRFYEGFTKAAARTDPA